MGLEPVEVANELVAKYLEDPQKGATKKERMKKPASERLTTIMEKKEKAASKTTASE